MQTIFLLGLFAALLPHTSSGALPNYTWNTIYQGKTVQFGLADTDDRIMRIDCEGGGRLSISVPMANDAQLGSHLWVTFSSANFRERRKAEVTEGVVPNLSVKVRQDDPAILALLSGHALRVARGENWLQAPGKGAGRVLRSLINACHRR